VALAASGAGGFDGYTPQGALLTAAARGRFTWADGRISGPILDRWPIDQLLLAEFRDQSFEASINAVRRALTAPASSEAAAW